MSGDDADRTPPQPPEKERGVHVSRDAPGAEATGGRSRSKLGFRVQAQPREKGDDPVFDNIESRRPPPEAARAEKPVQDDTADAEVPTGDTVGAEVPKEKEDAPGGALGRVKRFFFRRGD